MIELKKNLAIDVPKGAHTEVQRRKTLKKSIFTRTRIAVLSLILVLSLSVTGTLAYLQWTANQTPNRTSIGDVSIQIGETSGTSTTYTYDTDGSYSKGVKNKRVKVEMKNAANVFPANVTVSLVPKLKSKSYTNNTTTVEAEKVGYASFDQNLTSIQTDDNGSYISTGVYKVYLADGWNDSSKDPAGKGGYWTYVQNEGYFSYSRSLEKGESTQDLLSGVELQDSVSPNTYDDYYVDVVAQAIYTSS